MLLPAPKLASGRCNPLAEHAIEVLPIRRAMAAHRRRVLRLLYAAGNPTSGLCSGLRIASVSLTPVRVVDYNIGAIETHL